ncbi:MAG: alpha/beta fold hydrolase [Chlorobi bacterium]|nr:alpha/beta fold hydrolase [Chlorobiota bacterium]MCI0717338.1 alpha/beta fold hydrolase [Chlorobiota bacterium]
MVKKENIILKNPINLEISADLFYGGDSAKSRPLVIFCHGFKGFKDWGGFPYMMEKFSGAGFAAVSFNFSCNGVSKEKPTEFTKLDLFAQNTHTRELDDLEIIVDHFYNSANEYNIDKNHIAIAGHSRGGGTVILKAAFDERVKCIVTLSAIATVDRWTEQQKKRWREKGFIEIPNMRTKQMMRMNKTFLDDIEQNSERLNIKKAMGRLNIPALIIHGKEDLAVKYTDALELYENSNKKLTELYLIENTGHTFGTEHPLKGTTKAFEEVIGKSVEFLKKGLLMV